MREFDPKSSVASLSSLIGIIGTSIGCTFTIGAPFCAVSEAWCLASFPATQSKLLIRRLIPHDEKKTKHAKT